MDVAGLYRHPIKGLGAESLTRVALAPGAGMPLDRRFAITHGASRYDRDAPSWVPRRNFLVVAHSPAIARVGCAHDANGGRVRLQLDGTTILDASVDDPAFDDALNAALDKVLDGACGGARDGAPDGTPDEAVGKRSRRTQQGPYALVEPGTVSLTDSPGESISVMNTASLEALERRTGQTLDRRRFRGNLWFRGDAPWQEHDWVGRRIDVGRASLRVTEAIERCAAIDACPDSGVRDIELLRTLNRGFGHNLFGVLAEVVEGGTVAVGDRLSPSAPPLP